MAALTIMLLDSNVEALGELASLLRSRGLGVALANNWNLAREQARKLNPAALLISEELSKGDISIQLEQDPALRNVPCFFLVDKLTNPPDPKQLLRANPDAIARRLWSLEGASAPLSTVGGDFRGDLSQVGVTDLLQILSMNQRTGVLTLSTATGVGEVRLVQGEIVDAIYRRIEGSKALYRLLGETEGSFAFVSGIGTAQRRMEQPTHILLLEGLRQVDETRRCRQAIGSDQDALQAQGDPISGRDDVCTRVLMALEVPRTVEELLDSLADDDLAIVRAVQDLLGRSLLRRIERGAVRVDLASPEQMNVLSNEVRQLRKPGFSGNPRIILLATQSRLAAALHSLGRIADAWRPVDAAPAAPVPHTLACLRLNDGAELDVMGLPDAPDYEPLWDVTLPGTAAVVILGYEPNDAIEAACNALSIPVLRAEALIGGEVEEGDPRQMALLIRSALETAASR
jgi:hypothetical protein